MTVREALELLADKQIQVEVRRSDVFTLTGDYYDISDLQKAGHTMMIIFRFRQFMDYHDECGRYLVNQKVERVIIIHEAKFIGLNIIAAMRMVAQEIAEY